MSAERSARPPNVLPAWLALAAWMAGLPAMGVAMRAASPLGIRPALMTAELFLALPAVLALALWRIPWARGLALTRPTPAGWVLALLAGAIAIAITEATASTTPEGRRALWRSWNESRYPGGGGQPAYCSSNSPRLAAHNAAPAVCEEILFRGALLPSFERWVRPWGAVLLSALLFGIIHLDPTTSGAYTFYRVPFATSVGLGLGILRVRSGSLVPCIVAHATLNAITFFAVLLTAPSTELEAANLLQGSGLFLLGTAASVFLLRLHTRADS